MREHKPIPWFEMIDTLMRRKWSILVVTAAALVLSVVAVIVAPKLFKATSTIQLSAEPIAGARSTGIADQLLHAEMSLMKSPALIRSVLEEYADSEETPPLPSGSPRGVRAWVDSWTEGLPAWTRGTREVSLLDRQIISLATRIEAERVGRSNVVHVSFSGEDPEWAATFVNDLLRHHVERIAALRERSGTQTFFERQAELLAERRKQATESLLTYRRDQGSFVDADEPEVRRLVGTLDAQRVTTETQVLELQAKIQYLTEEMEMFPQTIDSEETITEDEGVSFLKSRLLDLEMERSDLLSRYTLESKLVRNLDRKIEETKLLLEEKGSDTLSEKKTAVNPAYQTIQVELLQAESELTAARARQAALGAQLNEYRRKLGDLENSSGELERLESELENARETHLSYLSQKENARLVSALDESKIVNLVVVEEATPPATPEPARAMMKIVSATLLGLALGIAQAFLRDAVDPSIKNKYQVSRATNLPVMAEIQVR